MAHIVGILLCNVGSPVAPSQKAVRQYCAEILKNKRMSQGFSFISSLKLKSSTLSELAKSDTVKYRSIWGEKYAPQTESMLSLARELQNELRNDAYTVYVRPASNFGALSQFDALKSLKEKQCSSIVVLPLFPQSSFSTTLVCEDLLLQNMKKLNWSVPLHFVDDYHLNSTYVEAIAKTIMRAHFSEESGDRLLFSFHTIPLSDIEKGDTYELQTSSSSLSIASELGLDRTTWSISYQGRQLHGQSWLNPSTSSALNRFAEFTKGRLFIVCPGYAVENLQTLFDVRYDYKKQYLNLRKQYKMPSDDAQFAFVPCLGKTRLHLSVLKDVIKPFIKDAHE